jgi:hypothetical protein
VRWAVEDQLRVRFVEGEAAFVEEVCRTRNCGREIAGVWMSGLCDGCS